MQRIRANPGDTIDAIDTPALVVDVDAFERDFDRKRRPRARSVRGRTSSRTSVRRLQRRSSRAASVTLYDWIVAARGGRVEASRPVEARGALG
jgi:hypothetical protein